jgi:hypothetical protein
MAMGLGQEKKGLQIAVVVRPTNWPLCCKAHWIASSCKLQQGRDASEGRQQQEALPLNDRQTLTEMSNVEPS